MGKTLVGRWWFLLWHQNYSGMVPDEIVPAGNNPGFKGTGIKAKLENSGMLVHTAEEFPFFPVVAALLRVQIQITDSRFRE